MRSRTMAFACLAMLVLPLQLANAGYINFGGLESEEFSLLGTAWNPGPGAARFGGNPAPGSATWSVMGVGLADASGFDAHGGGLTTDLTALYAGGVSEIMTLGLALDKWAAVSGFTNLGQVADGGGGFGAAGAAGAVGDIRIGAIDIDGVFNVLAHAYQPGTPVQFGSGNIAGDMHFDDDETWSDGGGGGTFDFHTVALHEFGHALGLGHSNDPNSVMYAFYGGQRRTLTADDIAGIQAIYGPEQVNAVPEPTSLALCGIGACITAVGAARRRRQATATAA